MYFVLDCENDGPPLNVRMGGYINLNPALTKAKTLNAAIIVNDRREVVHAVRNKRVLCSIKVG